MKVALLVAWFAVFPVRLWASESLEPGNGLESSDPTQIPVEVVAVPANKLGITAERVEARANQILRKAGITPVLPRKSKFSDPTLVVEVSILASHVFLVQISVMRVIFYEGEEGTRRTRVAETWNRTSFGNATSREFILDSLAAKIEVFCNEYQKANGR